MADPESHGRVLPSPPPHSRRHLLGALAGAAGAAALVVAVGGQHPARAGDDHDNSGPGSEDSGRGRGRGRGRGGDEPDDEAEESVAITGEVPPGAIEVRIVSDDAGGFVPGELTVDLGQTVTFVNAHDDEHTATGSGFDTGIIAPGGTATVALDEPGVFAYACQIHPEMTGRIAVRDASGAVPTPAPAAAAPAGATFSHTFAATGTFDYRCNLHPQMLGSVVVEGATVGVQAPAAGDPPVAATPPAETAATDPASDAALVGVWNVRLEPDAGLPGQQGLLTFHADGTLDAAFAATGIADPEEPTLGPAKGVWRADAAGGYELTAVALLLDPDDRFAGTLTLRETGHVSSDGSSLGGTFAYDLTDPAGVALGSGSGSGASGGTRIGLSSPAPVAAAPAASPTASTGTSVAVRDFAFEPARIEVPIGSTVTWTNQGAAPHTATASDGAFDTGLLETGAAGSATFDAPGTYAYACQFHPEMTGTVVVG